MRNIGPQNGSPSNGPNKLSAYLTKVSQMIKLPKVENKIKIKRKTQGKIILLKYYNIVREKPREEDNSQIINQ